jgi:serine/threonine protein phosphatase 1
MVLELVHKPRLGLVEGPQVSVPSGVRVYAVGDVHGRADLLDQVLADIDAHAAAHPTIRPIRIFLGDYLDRGPDSRDVIERLIAYAQTCETVYLKGNHEDFVVSFLDNPAILAEWRHVGGLETLMSYGLKPSVHLAETEAVALAERLAAVLPQSHRDFLEGLRTSFSLGDFFFVHAGVRPGIPLSTQRAADLLWIRHEFLASEEDFGKIVVHGHTPVPDPEFRPNRINIDTGAYATGRLTCLVIDGDRLNLLADVCARVPPERALERSESHLPAAENVIRATQNTLRAADHTLRAAQEAVAAAGAPREFGANVSLVPAADPFSPNPAGVADPVAAPDVPARRVRRPVFAASALALATIISLIAFWPFGLQEAREPVVFSPPPLDLRPHATDGVGANALLLPKPAITEASREAGAGSPGVAEPAAPTTGLATVQRNPQDLAVLVARGESLVAEGDLPAARLLLRRGAESGDARAALALAATYDPVLVEKLGIRGVKGDRVMARTWYEIAAQLGSVEAQERLKNFSADTH